jgi:hypothetical protein
MPKRSEDKYFGGQRGAAAKAFQSMQKTYGKRDGEHVYHATIAKRKRRSTSKTGGIARWFSE